MLAGFGEPFGLTRDHAFKIARAYGAGMGTGGICGAVTGAYMILGFLVGEDQEERRARFKTYELVGQDKIPAIRLGKRLLVPRKALEDLLASVGKK